MTRPFSPDEARALVGACVADSFATYEVREYDAATEQFALLERGGDGAMPDAPRGQEEEPRGDGMLG